MSTTEGPVMTSGRNDQDSRWHMAEMLVQELASFVRLLYRLFRDARVSGTDKALLIAAVGYVLTPIDLIPDVLGVAGRIDDLYLLGLVLDRMLVRAGPDILIEHWDGRANTLRLLLDGLDRIGSLVPGPIRRVLSGRVERA